MEIQKVANQNNLASSVMAPGGRLGKDEFLKLLVTELKSQDPLQPMEDREFITQLAQFSTLEQMQTMNKRFSHSLKLGALSLMGKKVAVKDGDRTVIGKVEKISFSADSVFVVVNGKEFSLDDVISVEGEVK